MAISQRLKAGVAFCPVMDMTDQRLIAYLAAPRSADRRSTTFLHEALSVAGVFSNAPLLVPVDHELLVSERFDAVTSAEAANCHPSDVIFVFPAHDHPGGHETDAGRFDSALRYQAGRLTLAGYRVGLERLSPLDASWAQVVAVRPAFIVLETETAVQLQEVGYQAAVAGLLAFAGRLQARLVAKEVATPDEAAELVNLGVFYGSGSGVHSPVVLDPDVALPGDELVRPSWFKERSVRALSAEREDAVYPVAAASPTQVADDRHLAALLIEWANVLSSADDPSAVLKLLAEIVPRAVPCDRMAIFEADWGRYLLQPRVLVGEEVHTLADAAPTLNAGITGWAFLNGAPYRCGRTADHPESAPIPEQGDDDESLLVIPLVSGDRRLGVLDLWRDGVDRFSDTDLERATLLGKLGADAWRRAVERAEVAERVVTDSVTGLLNKRWWEELAPREAAQAARSGGTIALLLVDLDGFKAVNDSYGHASGDLALRQVARAISSAVRSGDAVVRYGGDEFILLLRDCNASDAVAVATDVQLALASVKVQGRESLTASVGIAMYPEHGVTLEDVAVNADAAMYRAKAAGRNRISAYRPGSELEIGGTVWSPGHSQVHSPKPRLASAPTPLGYGARGVPPQLRRPDLRQAAPPDGRPPAGLGPSGLHPVHPKLGEDIEEERRRLRYAEELAGIGSFEIDLDSGDVEWSPEMQRMMGSDPGTPASVALAIERVHPGDLQGFARALGDWRDLEPESTHEMDLGVLSPDSREFRPMHLKVRRRELPDGRHLLSGTLQERHQPAGASDPLRHESGECV